ncbi:unnamed protein product [Ixodes persulcatus]
MEKDLECCEIRRARPDDLDQVAAFRALYGQQLGIGAMGTLWNLDPEGIFVAVTDDGKVLGTLAVLRISDSISYVTMHAVYPELRKKGLGKRLWQAVEAHLGPDRNAFLICGGFDVCMYHNRFGFDVVSPVTIHYIRPGPADISTLRTEVPGVDIVDSATPTLTSKVIDYDQVVSGFRRERLLALVLKEPGNVFKVAVHGHSVVGYGIVSTDISGMALLRIVYADNVGIAECLVHSLLNGFAPFVEKGLTGLLLAEAGDATGLDIKMSIEGIPCVKILYRREHPTCDYKRQFVVCA